MTHILVQQPGGKLAVWCSTVDNWIVRDATPADIPQIYPDVEPAQIQRWIADSLKNPQARYQDLVEVYRRMGQDWAGA